MDMATYADATQINSYTFQISLIHAMWGYQQNVYYIRGDGVGEYGNPRTLNNNAKWFGTEYVFLNPDYDPSETYELAGWELVHQDHEEDVELWRFPEAPGMATITSKPVILVIGKQETDSYMTIFRLANDGMLPYEDAFLVEGRSRVDQYTLEELRPFDMVLLYGYDYKKSSKAWETLSAYVEGGGSLFVDTGWEFRIPEWEFKQAPEVLPIRRLIWTDYGMAEEYVLGAQDITGDIDVGSFTPLIWEGQPWTLSGAEMNDVREWGQVVLSAADKPLIVAGQYGQGRVVWSGMNLLSHARYLGENEEEIKLMKHLLGWLTEQKGVVELADPKVVRNHPDQVEFSFEVIPNDVTWLYWREAFYPNWGAIFVEDSRQQEVPVFRAGPGFMLMPIESSSSNVTLQLSWNSSTIERLAIVPTFLGFTLLFAHVIDGFVFKGNGLTWVKVAATMWLPKPFLDEKTHDNGSKSHTPRFRSMLTDKDQGHLAVDSNSLKEISKYPDHDVIVDGNQNDLIEIPKGLIDGVENEVLLRSWLKKQGKIQDAWIGRILDRKEEENGMTTTSSDDESLD
jgi:hypothetical protein